MTGTTGTTTTLWVNHTTGEVSCTDHGGAYLAYAIAANPRRAIHATPLGVWVRWNANRDAVWQQHFGHSARCERCGVTYEGKAS